MPVIGRMTPNATPTMPAPMIRTTNAKTDHSHQLSTRTRSAAVVSVAAFWSLVCLTMSSMIARCAVWAAVSSA
jgi:small neutral amino acid transporter SnatA (MarC family)